MHLSVYQFFKNYLRRAAIFCASHPTGEISVSVFNPLNPELNPICHLLALLGAHHILHVSRIRVNAAGILTRIYSRSLTSSDFSCFPA
jgi:hypothetical protein